MPTQAVSTQGSLPKRIPAPSCTLVGFSKISALRFLVLGVSFFAIPDTVRLDNPNQMLWRGRGASKEQQTLVCLGDAGRKATIPGWDFGAYACTFAKSRSSVINTRSSARQRSESTESAAPESFSSEIVSAAPKPDPRRIDSNPRIRPFHISSHYRPPCPNRPCGPHFDLTDVRLCAY